MDELTRRHIQRRLDAWPKLRHIADRLDSAASVMNTTMIDPEIAELRRIVDELAADDEVRGA